MGTKISGPYKGFKFNLETRNALPAAITSLSATAVDFANVQLVFANVLNAVSYEYSLNGGAWTALAGTKIVTGLTGDTAYTLRVRGVGVKGTGTESPIANVTTLSQLPAQIIDLTATALTSTTVLIAYTDAARSTSHQYSLNNIDWFAVPGDKTLIGLSPGTVYGVRVRGVNAAGNGASSAPFTVTTPATLTYSGFSNAASDRTTSMNVVTNPFSPSTATSGSWQVARSLVGKTLSQPGYFEVTRGGSGSADAIIGLGGITTAINNYVGATTGSIGVYSNGVVNREGANLGAPGLVFNGGDRIMVAYNGTKVWFGKNGTWPSGHDPVANTGGYTLPAGVTAFFPMLSFYLGNGAPTQGMLFNFGQTAFAYTPPTGFPAWTTSAYPTSFGPEIKGSRVTLSAQNLSMTTTGGWATALARSPRVSGRVYWESTLNTNVMQGFTVTNADLNQELRSIGGFNIYPNDGTIRVGNTTLYTNAGGTLAVGTKLGLAWDGAKVYVRLNGVWLDGSDPVAGTGGFAYAPGAPVYAAIASSGFPAAANFGQSAYQYPAPEGYENWTVSAAPSEILDVTAFPLTATSAQLAFTPLPTAESYQYTLNSGSTWTALTSSRAISGLTANTAYTTLVRGVNTFNGLSSTPATNFTTLAAGLTYPVFNTNISGDTANAGMLLSTLRLRLPQANTWWGARIPSGKLPTENGYFEVQMLDQSGASSIGLGGIGEVMGNSDIGIAGSTATVYTSAGAIRYNNVESASNLGSFGVLNSTLSVAYKNGKVWFAIDGVWKNGNPATNTGGTTLPALPSYFPMATIRSSAIGPTWTFNMGATAFRFPVPAGFMPWNSSPVTSSLDPNRKHSGVTLSNGNTTATNGPAVGAIYCSTFVRGGKTSGKFYWETVSGDNVLSGIIRASGALTDSSQAASAAGINQNGLVRVNGTIVQSNLYPLGTKIGFAWDGAKLYVRYDGVWYGGSDPATGTGGWAFNANGEAVHAMITLYNNSAVGSLNMGDTPFDYPIPAGFTRWTFQG